jgi:hypothetical protein
VGIGTPVALLVGIILIIMGIGLFFLDNFKPGYKRDSDTVYAVLLLTVGILALLIWNANFAESLQLMVASGTIIALMIERIQSRSANSEMMRPAGGRSARRENDRSNRAYRGGYEDSPRSDLRVELDDDYNMPPLDDATWSRRIPGAREERPGTRNSYSQSAYLDQLSDESRPPRRSNPPMNRPSYDDEKSYSEERRRSSLQLEGDVLDAESNNFEARNTYSNRRRRPANRRSTEDDLTTDVSVEEPPRSSNRRRRPRPDSPTMSGDGDYVDYKPINPNPYPDQEMDNSANFDDAPEFR